MFPRLSLFAGALAAFAALIAVACGGDAATETETPVISATVAAATATPPPPAATSPAATATATATSAPTATATVKPAVSPAGEKPQVLWMLRDHGGTNLAVVRLATNTETTAVLSVFGSPGQQTGVEPQTDANFAKEHTISIPLGMAGPVALRVTATDRSGQQANAILEYGSVIVGTQYFGRAPGFTPKLTLSEPFRGIVSWEAISASTELPLGTVQIFGKEPGCTTAQQCQATLKATATQDTRTLREGYETHAVPVVLPDSPARDFQLLITIAFELEGQSRSTTFYQLDIPATRAAAGSN